MARREVSGTEPFSGYRGKRRAILAARGREDAVIREEEIFFVGERKKKPERVFLEGTLRYFGEASNLRGRRA